MTLYMKAKFYLKKPKMEEASFALFRKAQKLYQATNFEDFHVLHVSAFEHGQGMLFVLPFMFVHICNCF